MQVISAKTFFAHLDFGIKQAVTRANKLIIVRRVNYFNISLGFFAIFFNFKDYARSKVKLDVIKMHNIRIKGK